MHFFVLAPGGEPRPGRTRHRWYIVQIRHLTHQGKHQRLLFAVARALHTSHWNHRWNILHVGDDQFYLPIVQGLFCRRENVKIVSITVESISFIYERTKFSVMNFYLKRNFFYNFLLK